MFGNSSKRILTIGGEKQWFTIVESKKNTLNKSMS